MLRKVILCSVAAIVLAGTWGYSQDADESKPATRRLPNFFSKVGLRQSQRESIYAIQDKYAESISKLERQIDELRKQRDAEIEGILNEEQRAELKKLIDESRQRSAAKKSDSSPAGGGPKPSNE